jgi:hypothetical protein
MGVNELASELQEHLLSVVQIAQEIVVSAVETGAEQAQRVIPDYAERLAAWLPDAAATVDRAFTRTEEWLGTAR